MSIHDRINAAIHTAGLIAKRRAATGFKPEKWYNDGWWVSTANGRIEAGVHGIECAYIVYEGSDPVKAVKAVTAELDRLLEQFGEFDTMSVFGRDFEREDYFNSLNL